MRILNRLGLVAAIASAVAVALPAYAHPARLGSSTSVPTLGPAVLVQLNQIRSAHGLAPVRLNAALSAAADQHAAEMLARGYFEHESADGRAFWKRIARYYPAGQFRVWSVGENLLWSGGAIDAKGALKLWMASPEHRANILSPRWHEIGIAALYEDGAPGTFGGSSVTLVATDFGVRS